MSLHALDNQSPTTAFLEDFNLQQPASPLPYKILLS